MATADDVAAIKTEYFYQTLVLAHGDGRAHEILIGKIQAELVRRAEYELRYNHLTGNDDANPIKTDQEAYDILQYLRDNPPV